MEIMIDRQKFNTFIEDSPVTICSTHPQSSATRSMTGYGNLTSTTEGSTGNEFHDTHAETAHTEVESCLAHSCDHRIATKWLNWHDGELVGHQWALLQSSCTRWMTIYHENDDYDS